LPKFLGGDCECQQGCLRSDKGPWNSFDSVRPVGCKLKSGKKITNNMLIVSSHSNQDIENPVEQILSEESMYASADNKRRRGLDFPEEDKSESPKAHSMPKNSDYHFFPN
jgi:hypothetical protein